MVNGVLYASNAVGLVEAFDPGTGKTLWVQSPGKDGLQGTSNRGVAYWGNGDEARIITFRNSSLTRSIHGPARPSPPSGRTASSIPLRGTWGASAAAIDGTPRRSWPVT